MASCPRGISTCDCGAEYCRDYRRAAELRYDGPIPADVLREIDAQARAEAVAARRQLSSRATLEWRQRQARHDAATAWAEMRHVCRTLREARRWRDTAPPGPRRGFAKREARRLLARLSDLVVVWRGQRREIQSLTAALGQATAEPIAAE